MNVFSGKLRLLFLGLFLAAVFSGFAGTLDKNQQENKDALWYIGVEASCLNRARGNTIILAEERSDDIHSTLLKSMTTRDFDFDRKRVWRFLLGRRLKGNTSIEAAYFQLRNNDASASLITSKVPVSIGLIGITTRTNFKHVDSINAAESTQLRSLEFNVRTRLKRGISTLFGFRCLEVKDNLELLGTGTGFPDEPDKTDRTDSRTTNRLLGIQLGGDYTFTSGRFSLQLTSKAGLYLNDTSQDMIEDTDANPRGILSGKLMELEGEGGALAGTIEAKVTCCFKIHKNFSIQAGYHVLTLSGLALAPQQLLLLGSAAHYPSRVKNLSAGTNHSASLIYHGLCAGLNIFF